VSGAGPVLQHAYFVRAHHNLIDWIELDQVNRVMVELVDHMNRLAATICIVDSESLRIFFST